jgi:hypothetical protein
MSAPRLAGFELSFDDLEAATRFYPRGHDDNTYDEAGRRRDCSFNLSCLTRRGGCWDARLMLPDVPLASTSFDTGAAKGDIDELASGPITIGCPLLCGSPNA